MAGKSVFAIFIGFETKITGKILKKHLIFSKNVIEMVKSQYHFSKTEFRGTLAVGVDEKGFVTDKWDCMSVIRRVMSTVSLST